MPVACQRVHGDNPQAKQRDAGRIEDGKKPAASAVLQALFREADGEMEEKRGLKRSGR